MDILTSSASPSWQVYRLGQLFHERKTKVSDKDYKPLSVTMKGIVAQLETAAKSDDSENRRLVLKGDYFINSRSDRKGAGGLSPLDGSVSLISIVLEPNGIVPRFAHHLFRSTAFQEEFYRWGHGIVADLWTTRYGDMKNIRLALPNLPTQKAIADFLDRETARIDQLIENKQRMVGVLGEKRQAVISHVVTKGLEPDVRMKDSGVERLGDIPAHWEVKQLRRAIMFQRGHDLPTDEREEGDVAIVSSSGISSTHSRAVAKAPGIVTGRYGTIGQFHLICQDYWPLNTTLYSIDFCGNEPRFLLYMLVHMSPLFLAHAVKSAVPGVDRNDVHAEATVVPPISDQRAIAACLDEETANIDSLVAKVRQSIGRLREFRSALITASVTGQINVSTWGEQGTTDRRLDDIGEATSA